jgi:hypothetical protein
MKRFSLAFVLGFLVAGCTAFSYRYYGIELQTECYDQGKLLGPDASKDLPLATCKPDDVIKGKCVVMLVDEFERFKADHERLKVELKDCQKNCQ